MIIKSVLSISFFVLSFSFGEGRKLGSEPTEPTEPSKKQGGNTGENYETCDGYGGPPIRLWTLSEVRLLS